MDTTAKHRMARREALQTMATAAAVTPLAFAAQAGNVPSVTRPNILFIHCHDLGQHLHCYGVETVRTPNLDALAGEGVRFRQSFCTAPQCSPSRASLFTGRYPHSTGVLGLTHADFAWDLYPDEKHLGQYLKEAGYETAGIGIIHETRGGPKRCGLDYYKRPARATQATDEAVAYLEGRDTSSDRPFYLQVGFIEPHRLSTGKDADQGFLGTELEADATLGTQIPGYLRDTEGTRTELAELQGSLHHVDTQVGRILDALQASGLADDTLVIFTTDHGIAMPRAKCSVYDPGIQVSLIIRWPNRDGWHGGRVIEPMIQNIDVVPTLLDVLGLQPAPSLHGYSFAPLLDGRDYTERDTLFAEITYHDYYDPRRCVRTKTHKLIANFSSAPSFMDPSQSWRPRSDTVVPPNHALDYHKVLELFDLEADPWEQVNLAESPEHATVRDALLGKLMTHLRETDDPILQGAVTSPMHLRALEQLNRTGTA